MTLGMLMGCVIDLSIICKSCLAMISGSLLIRFFFPMEQYDVILSMDWLSKYWATIDFHKKWVILFPGDKEPVVYQAWMDPLEPSPILKACIGGINKIKSYGNFAIDVKVKVDETL